MHRRMVAIAVVAGLLLAGASGLASAETGPAINLDLSTSRIVLYATSSSTLTVSADVTDTVPIAGVTAVLTADDTSRPTPTWQNDLTVPSMTSTDGEHFTGSVVIPRNASPGQWTVSVTATDTGGSPQSATQTEPLWIVQNTLLSLHYTPSAPRLTGTVTFYGTLQSMQPDAAAPATGEGSYIPYPDKALTLDLMGRNVTVTTSSTGSYRYTTTVDSSGDVNVDFPGTIYRDAAVADAQVTAVRNATRIIDVRTTVNPIYRNAFVTVTGVLQANDPNGSDWLPYGGKTVILIRDSPVHYQTTTVTNSSGEFSLTLHGTTAAIAGIWYGDFPGTIYHAPSISAGYQVSTMTAPMRITRVYYNSPGTDNGSNTSLNEEYVTLTNEGDHYANLYDWTLRDRSDHVYTFTSSVYVEPGHSVTIHTGTGTNTATQLYWGLDYYVWNNTGDTAYLRNDRGESVDTCSWGDSGSSTSC